MIGLFESYQNASDEDIICHILNYKDYIIKYNNEFDAEEYC